MAIQPQSGIGVCSSRAVVDADNRTSRGTELVGGEGLEPPTSSV